jgi:putative endonuclease
MTWKFIILGIMTKGGCVYILTNKRHTVLYTGVTSDLYVRIVEHQEKKYANSFSARYNVTKLVYYESFNSIEEAIDREKQIKAGSRAAKEKLINLINPEWKDLFEEVSKW